MNLEKMFELEFNTDNTQIGFRLQYLEVLNWGTFHKKVWRIEPEGNNALLTGSIGSGKSTLVDALTCLLVPHHKIQFNKAAGAESKERSLVSYIKGYYKHEKDELNLKEKAVSLRYKSESDVTFSVVLANFNNTGYNQNITLAQVFWVKDEKPQKLLIISHKPLNIKEYFSNIFDVHDLKKRLKTDKLIEIFDDNFSQYSQQFRKHFGMNSDKAIDLFYQTVSMKAVSSLTSFVREQMLEKTDVKQQIEELKKRFSDLSRAHEAIVSLRQQKAVLQPMVDLAKQQSTTENKIERVNNTLQAIPEFFAMQKSNLLETEIQDCNSRLNQLNNQLEQIKSELIQKQRTESQLNQEIYNNGGRRLEEIARLIEEAEERKNKKRDKKETSYDNLTVASNLPTSNSEKTFYSNLKKATEQIPDIEVRQKELDDKQAQESGKLNVIKEAISREETELDSLQRRKTLIPEEMLSIRQQMMNVLEIDEDEIPFVGELIKVREDEKAWEGAIERLLHGYGLSMLVPDKFYKQVSQFVNAKQLQVKTAGGGNKRKGQRLEYYRVLQDLKYKHLVEYDSDSVAGKLEIKPDCIYSDWLEQELQMRFNLRCVSIEEFQRQKDVITLEGQIKTGSSRHVKDDRRDLWDRRNFILGWANTEKIKAVAEALQLHRNQHDELEASIKKIKAERSNNQNLLRKLDQLINFKNWNEINWQDEARKIDDLDQERNTLLHSRDILKTLNEQLAAVKAEVEAIQEKYKEKLIKVGGEQKALEDFRAAKDTCLETIGAFNHTDNCQQFSDLESELKDRVLTIKNILNLQEDVRKRKQNEVDDLRKLQQKSRESIIKLMKDYNSSFPAETGELSAEIESLPEYLKKIEEIIKQDLPRHEAKFKQMLNENTINDITVFDNKLDIHQKSIQAKIRSINEHLKEVEYNPGTFIEIETSKNVDKDIIDFKQDVKACYSNILDIQDVYNEDRFSQVKKLLDRFNSQANADIEWTNKVTDVRNWFVFNASERYREDNSPKEFYSGSGGKSGGQKEKLAYTILASALAYQFGLAYGEPKSKSFRFVVIDEAFGKGDDESTKFGLGLFKKLNLQLLIVTPLQKIHIIENHVNSLHYVSNLDGNQSELQNLTIEEYRIEKLKNELSALA